MELLRQVHAEYPFYGVRWLALHLGWSENKARRIRTLADVNIPRPGKRYEYGKRAAPEIETPANVLYHYAAFKDSSRPQDGMNYNGMVDAEAWIQDFTYLWFE